VLDIQVVRKVLVHLLLKVSIEARAISCEVVFLAIIARVSVEAPGGVIFTVVHLFLFLDRHNPFSRAQERRGGLFCSTAWHPTTPLGLTLTGLDAYIATIFLYLVWDVATLCSDSGNSYQYYDNT
jgi:hypothetical protein